MYIRNFNSKCIGQYAKLCRHRFASKLILTTALKMSINEVVYLYYALKIRISVEFTRTLTFLKYPANIHDVSLRTFVKCIYKVYNFAATPFKRKNCVFRYSS